MSIHRNTRIQRPVIAERPSLLPISWHGNTFRRVHESNLLHVVRGGPLCRIGVPPGTVQLQMDLENIRLKMRVIQQLCRLTKNRYA